MEGLHLFLMLFLVVGFAAGAGAVWLVLQGRTNMAYDRAKAEVQAGHAEVAERLRGKEEQVQALQSTLDQNTAAMGALKAEVEGLTAKQLAAESEKSTLAGKLEERDQRMAAIESELAAAKAELIVQSERVAPPPPPPPPPSAAPAIEESVLQVLARPIEEHLAELRVRLEQISTAPALDEQVLQGLARPIEEQLAGMRLRIEQIGAAPQPEQPVDETMLRTLARPIEDQISGVRQRLEQMAADHARSTAATIELRVRNAELAERLNNVTRGLCELRGALARSLDLCSLAVTTAETAVEQPIVEAVPEDEPVTVPV
jgi:hypothetical protein